MSDFLTQQFESYLIEKQSQGLYRSRQVRLKDSGCLDFSCNDYLSLAAEPRLNQAYQSAYRSFSAGSGGSLVLCGYHDSHRLLEQAFSEALGVEDCLLFSSGYVANLAVVSLFAQFGAHVLIDKAVHASIYDGLTFSGADFSRFLHNDLNDLSQKLQQTSAHTVVFTESVFSMSGQQAPLAKMAKLVADKGYDLIVDEAHGFGVFGPHGMGSIAAAGLTQQQAPLRVIPFGKALNGSGAVVAGKAKWIDALLQATRQPVYSTAISPAFAEGMRAALRFVYEADDRREHLAALNTYFKEKIALSSLVWRDSSSPIQQLQLGCPHLATQYALKLQEQAIRCFAIRQPTVPKQETGLRVILNYQHSYQDIDRLFEALSTCQA